jgi:hypothetical protein
VSTKDHDPLLKLAFLVSVSQIKGVSGVTARVSIILTNAFNFRKDKCWWSVSKLAKVVQASERQVKSAIKVFKEHHIFKIASGRTGKANEYKPNFNIIMQYPALASEKTLQKVRQFNAPQTINTNYKTNTTDGSKSKGWGKKPLDPLTVLITKTDRTDEDLLWRHKQGFSLDQIEEKRVKELLKKKNEEC